MLDFIRDWIEQITVAVIIVSIFEMLLPNGKSKKYIKMILGIFIVFNLISPFVKSSNLYNFNVNEAIDGYMDEIGVNNSVSQNTIDNKIEELYIKELEQNIADSVEELGYKVDRCKINANIYADDKDAGIDSINISISSKNDNHIQGTNVETNIRTVNEIKVEVDIENETNIETNTNSITDKDIKKIKKHLNDYYEIDKNIININ